MLRRAAPGDRNLRPIERELLEIVDRMLLEDSPRLGELGVSVRGHCLEWVGPDTAVLRVDLRARDGGSRSVSATAIATGYGVPPERIVATLWTEIEAAAHDSGGWTMGESVAGIVSGERAFCDAARAYLLALGVTPEVLDSYLEPGDTLRATRISDVYWKLLWSSQNANMRTAVISGSMDGGMMALADTLFQFRPSAVAEHYGMDSEAVLDAIVETVKPRGRVRRTPRSIWPQFCRSIVSGAAFLTPFHDAAAFYAWADAFDTDDRARGSLPGVISHQVSGLGFALSCDFLKELGYSSFGKPDVHIRKILQGLGAIASSASDPEAFDALTSFAHAAGLSPYHVDKLMWLVGSGNFYRHPEIGRVDTDRDGFVLSQRHLLADPAR